MILPESGRIVLIDDDESEAKPLINSLEKKGLFVNFFTGESEQLPNKPIPRVRVVFLDLVLGQSLRIREVISTLTGVLRALIDWEKNGPLLLACWTAHPQMTREISDALRNQGLDHLLAVLKKSECKNSKGRFVLRKVQKQLKEKLHGNESLELFFLWENLVGRAASNIANNFFQLEQRNGLWNDRMRVVFLKLAKAVLGENVKPTNVNQVIENAFHSLNSAFLDELRLETRKTPTIGKINMSFLGLANKEQNSSTDGKVNSKLILTQKFDNMPIPGNVYRNAIVPKVSIEELLKDDAFKNEWAKKNTFKQLLRHIVLEITPVCDHAQQKSLKSRMLPGVLWPHAFKNKRKRKGEYSYVSPIIEFDDELYEMVFDFRTFTSINFIKLRGKRPIFMVQNELLADIQSRLASHVSRLGVPFVETLKPKKKRNRQRR